MHLASIETIFLALLSICLAVPVTIGVNYVQTPDEIPLPEGPSLSSIVVPDQKSSPQPYEFGYEFGDGLGMNQHRREYADATGVVKGSYGYVDPLGLRRVVEYIADRNGYRAVVRSNEPGTASQNIGDAVYLVVPPPAGAFIQGVKPVN